jgi:hypothetical protein
VRSPSLVDGRLPLVARHGEVIVEEVFRQVCRGAAQARNLPRTLGLCSG